MIEYLLEKHIRHVKCHFSVLDSQWKEIAIQYCKENNISVDDDDLPVPEESSDIKNKLIDDIKLTETQIRFYQDCVSLKKHVSQYKTAKFYTFISYIIEKSTRLLLNIDNDISSQLISKAREYLHTIILINVSDNDKYLHFLSEKEIKEMDSKDIIDHLRNEMEVIYLIKNLKTKTDQLDILNQELLNM